ncbi:MAG: hypothetical protein HY820_27650 [Acidobacteria bacterium]|nr:hypothetical protein [Acidobacteriota bacterium]
MGIRDKARQILSIIPPIGQQINSTGPTAGLFNQVTNMTQATLQANWDTGGIMTSCNGFTGWYSNQLGSPFSMGRFDLDTYLPKKGKGNAWIKSTPDKRPKYGDICRFAKFHVNVSLDFEGDVWTHADGGQGGKRTGYDIVKRIRDTTSYDPAKLIGWVDIELFFGEASEPASTEAKVSPVPDWLQGWWNVKWRGQAFYYYFDRQYKAQWTQQLPRDTTRPPLMSRDTGNVAIDSPSEFSIKWGATGSVEKFSKAPGPNPMRGTWNDKEPLTASKM